MRIFFCSALFVLLAYASNAQVVITEFMFNPTDPANEWVELYNPTATAISVNGWTIEDSGGTAATLSGSIVAGGYLVVARNRSTFLAEYQSVDAACVIEATFRQLNDGGGDRITLRGGTTVEEVSYRSKWGEEKGRSLERRGIDFPASDSASWYPSTAPERATPCRANSTPSGASFDPPTLPFLLRYDRSNRRITVAWEGSKSPLSIATFTLTGERKSVVMPTIGSSLAQIPVAEPGLRIVVATWQRGQQQAQLVPCF